MLEFADNISNAAMKASALWLNIKTILNSLNATVSAIVTFDPLDHTEVPMIQAVRKPLFQSE